MVATTVVMNSTTSQKLYCGNYEAVPLVGDTVVIAAKPFIRWLYESDKERDPKFTARYSYNQLPPRYDNLDKWLYVTATVLNINEVDATLKSTLGTKKIPLYCLRVLRRE